MKEIRRKLNDDECRQWLDEHFVYSVELFTKSAELYSSRKYDSRAIINPAQRLEYWCIDMALLQAFVTEFRNLIDFFYKPIPTDSKYYADARALDFFETEAEVAHWEAARPAQSKLLADSYEEVGAKLAHLTYKRDEHNDWKTLSLWVEVYALITAFLGCLPAARKGNVSQRLDWLEDIRRIFLASL